MNEINFEATQDVNGGWRAFSVGLLVNLAYDVAKTIYNDTGSGNSDTSTYDAMGNRTGG